MMLGLCCEVAFAHIPRETRFGQTHYPEASRCFHGLRASASSSGTFSARIPVRLYAWYHEEGIVLVNLSVRSALESAIGYTFDDPTLLNLAMTHSSAVPYRLDSNERLEFLGDSILGLIACKRIFERFPDMLEGDMTKIKSAAVSRRTCAKITRSLGLHTHIQLGKGMQSQPRLPQSLAAALLESITGAIYLDGGFEAAKNFLLPLLDPVIEAAALSGHQDNFKSVLQQYVQHHFDRTPTYRTLDEKGPDHAKCFHICVEIGDQQFDPVWGKSKKQAEQEAAFIALDALGMIHKAPDGTITINPSAHRPEPDHAPDHAQHPDNHAQDLAEHPPAEQSGETPLAAESPASPE